MFQRLSVVVAVLSSSAPAFAQINESFQLGLSTDLVSSSTLSFEAETPVVGGVTVESEGDIDNTAVGFSGDSGVTLNLGYGLSEQLVLGALLRFGTSSSETDAELGGLQANEEEDTTSFSLGPKLEFAFLDEGDLRPFVLGSVAYVSVTQEQPDNTIEFSGGQLLAGVGLHWFLAPGFSFDPMLYGAYAALSGESDPDMGNTTELEGSLTGFGLSVGLSGWIH